MPEPHPYLTLKLALALFKKPPDKLDAPERQRVEEVAARHLEIERRILATPEAARTIVPWPSIDPAFAELRGRYASEKEFIADMKRADLDPPLLVAAIARELRFNAVLDGVASQLAAASDTDVEIFYLMHRERFRRPERRTLRHILVTINEDLPGSERALAGEKIRAIHARLAQSPGLFAEQALQYSECPTAMNGGLLGTLEHGKLYAELADVAFALAPGELSGVVESPLGFHLIDCVSIHPAEEQPLASAQEKIREHLTQSQRNAHRKAWIAGLPGKAHTAAPQQPTRNADDRERRVQ